MTMGLPENVSYLPLSPAIPLAPSTPVCDDLLSSTGLAASSPDCATDVRRVLVSTTPPSAA